MKCGLAIAGLLVLLCPAFAFTQNVFPAEASGYAAATDSLLAAYGAADVIVLGEGHGRKPDSDFRVALVRNPKFAETVRVIVLEMAQPELAAAVEQVNQALAPDRRIRMFVAEAAAGADRNAAAVALVRARALDIKQKALVVFGSGHVWRRFGGVTRLLEQEIPGRVLVIETIAPTQPSRFDSADAGTQFAAAARALEDTLHGRQWPVLVPLAGSAAARLIADPFYLGQAMLGPTVTIGDLADAVVYFGIP